MMDIKSSEKDKNLIGVEICCAIFWLLQLETAWEIVLMNLVCEIDEFIAVMRGRNCG